jgi:hypothetical protein
MGVLCCVKKVDEKTVQVQHHIILQHLFSSFLTGAHLAAVHVSSGLQIPLPGIGDLVQSVRGGLLQVLHARENRKLAHRSAANGQNEAGGMGAGPLVYNQLGIFVGSSLSWV